MMLRVTSRAGRAAGHHGLTLGIRASVRHPAVYHHAGVRLGHSRPSAAWVERTWWHRLMDDRDLVGAKVLLLAALLVLTALLERVV
jgi:hypothetical protein